MQSDPHAPVSHSARFEFFDSLNDFLSAEQQGRGFVYRFLGTPSVKDTIEAIGVPHPEIGCMQVNGQAVDFSYRLQGGERVAVYPWELDRDCVLTDRRTHLQPELPDPLRFVVDVNLGKLAAKLRLLGFDTLYRNDLEDNEIVAYSVSEQRFILTRDIGVLKYAAVRWGYWLRSDRPEQQVREVVCLLGLSGAFAPFTRCSACNGLLSAVDRDAVRDRLPADTRRYYACFFECDDCRKLYWKGSHYLRILDWIEGLANR